MRAAAPAARRRRNAPDRHPETGRLYDRGDRRTAAVQPADRETAPGADSPVVGGGRHAARRGSPVHPPVRTRMEPFADLPLAVARRLDAVCRRYEAAWADADRPQLEDYLADAAGP